MVNLSDPNPLRTRAVLRAATTLPHATQTAYFTVTGRVLITQIVGEVTVQIQSQQTVLKLISNPTVGTGVDMCALLDTTGDVIGTIYTITGTLTDNLVPTTSGAVISQANAILVSAGTIDLDTDDDSSGGQTKWTVHYIPLDPGSKVVAA